MSHWSREVRDVLERFEGKPSRAVLRGLGGSNAPPATRLVVLIGYALSGERTLKVFYERLSPFADPFMALFGRKALPDRSTPSRFLAALDQASVEALRTPFPFLR
jgi:hypothetical protein